MALRTLPRLLRTVWHLRPSQVGWRLRYSLERRLRKPSSAADLEAAVDLRGLTASELPPVFHRPGPGGEESMRLAGSGRFLHLNREAAIGRPRPDWMLGPCAEHRLWVVTLHYHGWAFELAEVAASDGALAAEAADLFRHYVGDWLDRCDVTAPGARALAWNSFAIATRAGWWIRSYLLAEDRLFEGHEALRRRFLASLRQQAAYLADHIEWDLRGNHVLRDLVGLAWAGRFFDGPEADGWSATAARLVPEQLAEQVLGDGAHFERSPMYHVHAMEDVLSLGVLLTDDVAAKAAREAWTAMAGYLNWLRHPDGEVPLLNDAAQRAVSDPGTMLGFSGLLGGEAFAGDLPAGGRYFEDAGLVVWHGDPWSVFFDVGPVGPDFIPGHGHADNLTVECSFGGRRVFVDPGTFAYDEDPRRLYDRSTGAHNTVCVDETDSSEVWHIFRVGRRARPVDVHVELTPSGLRASAGHDGYRRLRGRPRHQRELELRDDGTLVIVDRIHGAAEHRVRGGLLIDPAWTVEQVAGGFVVTCGEDRLQVDVQCDTSLALEVSRAPYHPEYGREIMTRRVEWSHEGELPLSVRIDVRRV